MKSKKISPGKRKRIFWITILGIASIVLILAVWCCLFYLSSKRPALQQPIIEHLVNNKPTLIKQYTFIPNTDYTYIRYQPRKFVRGTTIDFYPDQQTTVDDAGIYNGWDVLNLPQTAETVQIDLNRPATVVFVSRGVDTPSWLTSWHKEGSVIIHGNSYPTYRKVVTKLSFQLHTIYSPVVLFAEQDGKPSVAPTAPAGKVIPQPNQSCPAWVHDEYQARGPDGKLYPTWHPQIDPVYWCYFNHDHGSDPSLFDKNYRVPFGYAGQKMGMHEVHQGFKVYVWDDNYGHLFLALQHQGTSTNQAACGRYHELDIITKDKATNKIVAEQYFVGDFGASKPLVTTDVIRPTKCPGQSTIEKNNVGVRYLPVKDHGAILDEPWTVNNHGIIGFSFANFTVETYDSARMCTDITCDQIMYTGLTGTNRVISYVYGFGPKFGIGHSGIFYTDPMGQTILPSTDPHAVRQYILPGTWINSNIPFTSTEEASCRDIYGSGGIMTCGKGLTSVSTARENSIKIPN